MNPIIFIILLLVAVAATMIFVVNPLIRKKDAKLAQKSKDYNIEKQLMYSLETNIQFLAEHSDIERIAGIISCRIKNFMERGMSPDELMKIFKDMQITEPVIGPRTEEEKLRSYIQANLLQILDSHDIEVWQIKSSRNKKENWQRLNDTFLNKTEKNGFIMSLQLN